MYEFTADGKSISVFPGAESGAPGTFLMGKSWNIPADVEKPDRIRRHNAAYPSLLDILKVERSA